jgi:hypothetical protein
VQNRKICFFCRILAISIHQIKENVTKKVKKIEEKWAKSEKKIRN